jgi:hypothetical protein
MKESKRHPIITYITQVIFIGLIYLFYREQLNNKQADTFDNFVFRAFAGCLILVSLTLTVWTIFRRKKIKFWFGTTLLLALTIMTFRICYKAVYSLPYGQRFLIQNKSGLTLTNVKLISDTIISVADIKPNETVKAEYKNYLENTSIDLAVESLGYKDTVNLVSGLTNSVGYLFDVKVKFENNRYKVEVTN